MRILVVDDNRSSATALARALEKHGEQTEAVFDGATAIERLTTSPPDLVLTDLKMEPVDGMAVLQAARSQRPPVEVIVFTAYGAVDTAVTAMQLGARDFLTKPVTLEQVIARLDDLKVPERPAPPDQPDDAVFHAEAPASKNLLRTLRRVAEVPSHVWLEGEIGSGRGHAAWTIHQASRQRGQPFATLDLNHPFAWPEHGTVVLPNVDDLPDDLQRDLVRQLHAVPPDVRLVATASPDARMKVTEGRLRPELYYHLAVIVLSVPPLRERHEDILPILQLALRRFGQRYRREPPTPTPGQVEKLVAHAWPGNIRELLNVAERAVVMGPEALDLEVARRGVPGLPNLEPGFSLSDWLESMERRILVEALRRANGDRNEVGRLLGVERNTLRYKLNKYELLG
jgi:DNA-binding NtrC family response regulator